MITKEHRQQIEKDHDVKDGVIMSPGKFEGAMIYVPAFWWLATEGCEDDLEYKDDILISVFNITEEDREVFPELKRVKTLELWEDSQGFVCDRMTGV